MSNVIKLQEEELQNITTVQNQITQLVYNLGQLEIQKSNVLTQFEVSQSELNKLGKELQEKYGEGDLDLKTGELTLTEKIESTD